VQRPVPGFDGLGGPNGSLLLFGQVGNARGEAFAAVLGEAHLADLELGGVEDDLTCGFGHLQLDSCFAVEAGPAEVGRQD